MEEIELSKYWKSLSVPSNGAYETLLLKAYSHAQLLVGVNDLGKRCFILEKKGAIGTSFSQIQREKLRLFRDVENKFFVLELLDDGFVSLFDELIMSVLGKVSNSESESEACEAYLQTIRDWVDFFERRSSNLSFEKVLGLFGELVLLHDLLQLNPDQKREVIRGWTGPLKEPRDFVYPDLVEVKSAIVPETSVSISNESQIDYPSEGMKLYLALVEVSIDDEGQSIRDLVNEISSVLRETDDGMRIFLSLLQHVIGCVANLDEYDHLLFNKQSVTVYDASNSAFPAIRKSELPYGISKTKYLLEMTACEAFRIPNHPLSYEV